MQSSSGRVGRDNLPIEISECDQVGLPAASVLNVLLQIFPELAQLIQVYDPAILKFISDSAGFGFELAVSFHKNNLPSGDTVVTRNEMAKQRLSS
jgi:hypothetical protein